MKNKLAGIFEIAVTVQWMCLCVCQMAMQCEFFSHRGAIYSFCSHFPRFVWWNARIMVKFSSFFIWMGIGEIHSNDYSVRWTTSKAHSNLAKWFDPNHTRVFFLFCAQPQFTMVLNYFDCIQSGSSISWNVHLFK